MRPFRTTSASARRSTSSRSIAASSASLNLKHAQGKDAFKKLAAVSDVLVENYRPGALKELGLDYDVLKAINPRLIYASISGFCKRSDLRGPTPSGPHTIISRRP